MCCYRIKPFAYKRDIRTCLQFGVLATCHHTSWQLHNPSPFPSTLSLPAHLLPYWILNLPIANKDMLLLSQGTWDRGHARIAAASSWFLPIHAWERENKRNKGEEGRGFVSLLQLDRSMANKGKVCKMDGIFWIWPFMMASYTKIFVFTDLTDIPDHGSFCSKWFTYAETLFVSAVDSVQFYQGSVCMIFVHSLMLHVDISCSVWWLIF